MTYEEVKARLTYNGAIQLRFNSRHTLPGQRTYLCVRQNGVVALRYHNTDIVAWFPCGRVMLSSGGHRTATTKRRIVEYTGVDLHQYNFQWAVKLPGGASRPFSDGMAYRNGVWLDGG